MSPASRNRGAMPVVARTGTRLAGMGIATIVPPPALRRLVIAGLLVLGAVPSAQAQTTPDCSIDTSAANIDFGAYDPILDTASLDAVGRITVTCVGNERIELRLSHGSSGTYAARTMTAGTRRLAYNLYLDAGRTIVFGDGSGGSQAAQCQTGGSGRDCATSGTQGARQATLVFHGAVPPAQDVVPGLYADNLTVTVDF